jgi:hypothetical protein
MSPVDRDDYLQRWCASLSNEEKRQARTRRADPDDIGVTLRGAASIARRPRLKTVHQISLSRNAIATACNCDLAPSFRAAR